MASWGAQTGQVHKAWIPSSSGHSTANLVFHRWIKCSRLPSGTVEVTVGVAKSEDHRSPAREMRDCCVIRLRPLPPPPPNYAPGVSVLNVWAVSLEKDGLEDRVS